MAFLRDFSEAVRSRRAAVFVGAGLSKPSGLPGWDELIEPARREAEVPLEVKDAPLAAEYIQKVITEASFNRLLLKGLALPDSPKPTLLHDRLVKLPLLEYWTTNYDLLLELAFQQAEIDFERIVNDTNLGSQVQFGDRKQLFKMHGTLNSPEGNSWESDPVITRTHFEKYEVDHPRFWAQLRAQFLTRSFLFMGLSFDDPNVNVLLRLARSLEPTSSGNQHYAIMKREVNEPERTLQSLRVNDLMGAGIEVELIDDYSEQDALLSKVEVRTRNANVFVAGSGLDSRSEAIVAQTASRLAEEDTLAIISFGGEAATCFVTAFKDAIRPGAYRPERMRHYYRKGDELTLSERIGTAIFTDLPIEHMRAQVIPRGRAMLVFGGGERTEEEAEIARANGVSVVPVAATGGAALKIWQRYGGQLGMLNLDETPETTHAWDQLDQNEAQATLGAHQLIHGAMFG